MMSGLTLSPTPLRVRNWPTGMGASEALTSGQLPGSTLSEVRHFLALLPQCFSKRLRGQGREGGSVQ